MMKYRYLTKYVTNDLQDKMVFIGGPRQVGKTTLCRDLVAKAFKGHAYYNWDDRADRKALLLDAWQADAELLIFDEIHKYRYWKSFIKGKYDKLKKDYKFLVTGSARLDIYRRGGDSLQGRYHYYRLHPFTLAEAEGLDFKAEVFKELCFSSYQFQDTLLALDTFGGFPEPFTKQDKRMLRRWQNQKTERLFREDISDLSVVRDLSNMRLLSDILPARAGTLLALNSLREDLDVSHRAVSHWMDILEALYYHFRIYPFSSRKIRSLKKEPKLYLWDWSQVEDEGRRFENLIASHLLKFVHFLVDYEGYKAELHYLRDVDKREVDFLVTINSKPWFAVEAKLTDTSPSNSLQYFKEKLAIPLAYQVLKRNNVDVLQKGIRVISASKYLTALI